ncbi:MAG: RnfABCDGE type electron transport complex subunit G [Planctomycetota bacterium]
MKDAIKFPLVLFLITAICGGVLGYLYKLTEEPIKEAEKAKTRKSLYEIFGPEAKVGDAEKFTVTSEDGKAVEFEFYTVTVNENGAETTYYATIGQSDKCYTASVPIQVMVGVDAEMKLKRIAVVKSAETPGLGENIKVVEKSFYITDLFKGKKSEEKGPDYDNRQWLKQFNGKTEDELVLDKNGGDIQAVAGATITSNAVILAVKDALRRLEKVIESKKNVQ